jgi:hypothetical protein
MVTKMVVIYDYLYKDKWVKEQATFDTKEQADNFVSILKDNENYRDFRLMELGC